MTVVFDRGLETSTGVVHLNLQVGEVVTGCVIQPVTPVITGSTPLSVALQSLSPLTFEFTGGVEGIAYKAPLVITTSQRTLTETLVVNVARTTPYPHGVDPDSISDLLGTLKAGEAALAVCRFVCPASFDFAGSYITWEVLTFEGAVLNSGLAYDVRVSDTGMSTVVEASSIVSVPSDSQFDNPKCTLRYTLHTGDTKTYLFEQLTLESFVDISVGAQSSIEILGDPASLTLVSDKAYQNYQIDLLHNTKLLGSLPVGNPTKVSGVYSVTAVVDTSALQVSLMPYSVLWKMWSTSTQVFRDTAQLWVINDSIALAMDDVKAKLNKAHQTLYGVPDSQFPEMELIRWMRRAADAFNGAYGQFTNFTFTNAQGVIREMWLLLAEKYALESQYLLEAEKAFNYSGAAISLDVDKTSFIDSAISRLNQTIDQELKPLKQNLIIKGAMNGDGSMGFDGVPGSAPRGNNAAAVGLSINAASVYNGGLYSGSGRNSIFIR